MPTHSQQLNVRKTVVRLVWVLLGMVLFTVSLVPLYQVFCDITGLNGRNSALTRASEIPVLMHGQGETKQVSFVTHAGNGLAVSFSSLQPQQQAAPGGKYQVMFRFRNLSNKPQRVRAVPSVSPAQASQHLLKIECFCFQEMMLAAGEVKDVPLVYFLSAAFPADIASLTLAYTLFPVSPEADMAVGG
ncbi:cytochrome c oxidase assembly protein [Bacterioplanoides pacificum]|uniref:Cytochrome c oxidase assembly protein CtaG n=1 Tax=Bacterioplanoides pacificum TaxID=1171596 RepID=A0ABV7VRD0_9GAMM